MIDYSGFAYPKGTPRVVAHLTRDRAADLVEARCRAKVNDRDGHQCFWPGCQVYAYAKHHVVLRSQGGQFVSSNLLSSCKTHHDYFHAGLIQITGDPDQNTVKVHLTALGKAAKIRIRKAVA